jgi:ribose 5-phosphate isomerase RpiB
MVTEAEALAVVDTWLATPLDGGRHQRRIEVIDLG